MAFAAPAAADFGPLGPDAGPLGKGGAWAAEAEGPSAAYWNPAGLGRGRHGFDFLFSYGMLQRPDHSAGEYGATNRFFIGCSWLEEGGEKDRPGLFGAGLAAGTPWPRFEYSGVRQVAPGAGGSAFLSMKSSEDYSEVLAAAALNPLRGIGTPLGGMSLSLGLSIGLGMSSSAATGGLYQSPGGALLESDSFSGMRVSAPVSLGLIFSLSGGFLNLDFGVRYRGVLGLSGGDALSFPNQGYKVAADGAFMPPPQEGAIGLSALFFKRIAYSVEFSWLFFDSPDEFPNAIPHSYPVFKFGFEYRAIGPEEGEEYGDSNALFLRFGVTQSFIGTDNDPSIFTAESTGFYLGLGLKFGPVHIDVFFTQQIPGEGDVDKDSMLAGVSVGMR